MLDIVSILRTELPTRRIPAACVACLSGISSGRLSSYLNQNVTCPGSDATKLIQTWEQIKKLLEFAAPLPLNFRDAGAIAECIRKMENKTLQIIVGGEEPLVEE